MSIEIKVPAMGESVTEATVARWFKKEGDAVSRDEPLLELETDKVTVEVPAPADGAIESISVKAGDTVQVGATLGAISEGAKGRHAPVTSSNPDAVSPKSSAAPEADKPEPPRLSTTDEIAAAVHAAIGAATAAPAVMPSARRVAEENGIEPPRCTAPARTAASPRPTCWQNSKPVPGNAPSPRLRRCPPVRAPTRRARSA